MYIAFLAYDRVCDREGIQVCDMLMCVVRQCYIFCQICYEYENQYVSLGISDETNNLSVCLFSKRWMTPVITDLTLEIENKSTR